ncbi:hypothetical protein EOM39_05700 [Candidatus Gracilibacteria bacterium]|nr:hypothetical protein [Candidatus Gracilibacteria bacterium]
MDANIPSKKILIKIAQKHYPTGHRMDKQRGTNCTGEMLNYINEKGENIRLFVKKAFLRMNSEVFEGEYKLLKSKLKNIIPNQGFVGVGNDIFAFCCPIEIKVDFLYEKNQRYIFQLLKNNPKLLKQLKFFIKCFDEFVSEGKILDLQGKENLVISNSNKLYYTDSFLVFSEYTVTQSLSNIEILRKLVLEVEKTVLENKNT